MKHLFLSLLLALVMVSCSTSQDVIESATKSAVKLASEPTDKNIRAFRENYAKADTEIKKLNTEAQIDGSKYIKLNNCASQISALGKALNVLSGGNSELSVRGVTESLNMQVPDYTELLDRAKEGAIVAYEAKGDAVMTNPNASASQLEGAMKNYLNAGDQYKADEAKSAMITKLLADGERGFKAGQYYTTYESAMNALKKAADYGSNQAAARYDDLMHAIGMTLVINIPYISTYDLQHVENSMPLYVEVVQDMDVRKPLRAFNADFIVIMDHPRKSGHSYRDAGQSRTGSTLELQLIDLRPGANMAIIGSWPINVTYPEKATTSARNSAEQKAFEKAVYSNAYEMARRIKDIRVVPRRY